MTDPYEVLNVPSTATDDEVKKAYHALARKYQSPGSGPKIRLLPPDAAGFEANRPSQRRSRMGFSPISLFSPTNRRRRTV